MTEPVIRLFISSPCDVSAERRRAALVVDRLNGEFAGRVRIEAVLYEEHFYSSHTGFQEQIVEAADCDIVIAIFGARLGTTLHETFPHRLPTGACYPSGTAYEVLSAIEARKKGRDLPDIFVFRYPHSPAVPLDAPDRPEIEAQWTALKSFFETWFRQQGGAFVAAFHEYASTDDFSTQVEACLRDFLARHGFVTTGPVWDRATRGSPFPGLLAFEADRRPVFFGRDRAIEAAVTRLRAAGTEAGRLPFLLVIGASGAGKSSLLRAGIMPRLTTPGVVPEIDLWRPAVMTPGLDPFLNLADALLGDTALGPELRAGAFGTPEMLTRQLATDPDLAVAPVAAALAAAAQRRMTEAKFATPQPARIALAVDQAERLLTETGPAVALQFATLLARLVECRLAYVVMALRSDSYGRFQSIPPLLALREAGASYDLVPPGPDELEAMIIGPARACDPRLAFEPGLAGRLAADAKGGDALPLLQIALARLYAAQGGRGDGVLRAADYPGMDEAVTEAAQAALQGLPQAAADVLPALVAAMVTDVSTGEDGLPVASIAPLDRAAFTRGEPARDALLDAFIDSRLLTADSDGTRIVVRPAHEALLRIWPRAVAIIRELEPVLRARRALEPLVRDWQAAPAAARLRHLEVSPALLEDALKLTEQLDVEPAMASFIAACAAAAEARRRAAQEEQDRRVRDAEALAAARRRTTQVLGVGFAAALLLAGVAGWQGWLARQARDRAEQALASATDAANSLVFDLAQRFHDANSVPVAVVKDILDRATQLQAQLTRLGNPSSALLRSQAAALGETSSTLMDQGDTQGALDAARQAQAIFQLLLEAEPSSTDLQRDLSVSFDQIGDALVAQGNLTEALASYRAGLDIAQRLAKADPGNAGWQRDLSVSFNKVGDVLVAQGNLTEALASYRAGLDIAQRLAKADPGNAGWQRDLAVSYAKLGFSLLRIGRTAEGRDALTAGRRVIVDLLRQFPDHPQWKQDLAWFDTTLHSLQP